MFRKYIRFSRNKPIVVKKAWLSKSNHYVRKWTYAHHLQWCCFMCRFQLVCVQVILGSVKVNEWEPFGKELLTQLTVRSLRNLSICSF